MKILLSTLSVLGSLGLTMCSLLGALGQHFWAFDLLSHFQIQYLLASLLLLGMTLILGRWISAVMMLAVLGLSTWNVSPLFLPKTACATSATAGTPDRLKVLSLNVLTANSNYEAVRKQLLEANADIIFLMEINAKWRDELATVIQAYPFQLVEPREDNFGVALLTRLTVAESSTTYLGNSPVPSVLAKMTWNDVNFAFFGIHTLPPISARQTIIRDKMFQELADEISSKQSNDQPYLILGDMNSTIWSSTFQKLVETAALENSARGRGWKPTWSGAGPAGAIPIDHALFSGHTFCAIKHETLSDVGSDHRAIAVELSTLPRAVASPTL